MRKINFKKIKVKNKKLIIIIILFLVAMALAFIFLSGTLSKYSNKTYYNHGMTTSEFNFVSDKLDKEGATNVINNYNSEQIPFNISNGVGNNVTSGDITYNITCSVPTGYTCNISNGTQTSGTLSDTITYNGESQTKNYNLVVTKTTGVQDSITATVTATSSSPYIETLTGSFIINFYEDTDTVVTSSFEQNDELFCEYVIINNSNEDKNISVSINSINFAYDETCEVYKDKLSYSNNSNVAIVQAVIPKKSIKNLIIFKLNNTECSATSINITQ